MPNDVISKLQFANKEDFNKARTLLVDEDGNVDFNILIPMPAHEEGVFYADGNIGSHEQRLYGANTWYHWRRENWGTKWNAYDSSVDEENLLIEFTTAWGAPWQVLDKLGATCNLTVDDEGSNTVEVYKLDVGVKTYVKTLTKYLDEDELLHNRYTREELETVIKNLLGEAVTLYEIKLDSIRDDSFTFSHLDYDYNIYYLKTNEGKYYITEVEYEYE